MADASAGGLLSPAEHHRLALQMERRPMVFFIAKGPANSCGPGCDQWIAAEGALAPGTAQRLQDFLATSSRRSLPVFFHSRGGNVHEAFQIGQTLRKHRMTAGIGRTVTERCRVFSSSDEACQSLISSGGDVKARLSPRDGQCHSACVYAFIGAASRRVLPGAMLGVHAARIDLKILKQQAQDVPNARPPTPADVRRRLQRYVSVMGVDPRLEETASKIDTRRIYILSRDEVSRFGIETDGPYESQWVPYRNEGTSTGLLKSVSSQSSSDDRGHTSAAVRIECVGTVGLRLAYQRVLPSGLRYLPTISVILAGNSVVSQGLGVEQAGVFYWGTVFPFRLLEEAAEKPPITVIENYSPLADRSAKTVNISTSGLPAALTNLKKLCTEHESSASSQQRPRQPRGSRI
ncbi:MAG TPA: hypothetical protein VIU42_18095 [Xanthobacteraceae bacterium]